MAYIEEEMKKRKGDASTEEDAETESKRYQDIYDELYKIPEHLRVNNLNIFLRKPTASLIRLFLY